MTFAKSIITLSTIALLSGCIVIATPSHADVHLQKELVLDAQTLKMLDISAGAGSLSIAGREGIDEITVKADIYTSSEEKLYELALSGSGKTAYLVAHNSSHSASTRITWGNGHRIDLEVIVPNSMILDVTDGSGPINIHNISADVNVKDGSGELVISKITGDVNVEDGSGSIELVHIKGHVEIEDGSGSIEVIDVSGNTNIDDGSGDLTVRKVTGMVTIEDGSGDIDIENAGDLTILEAGSGRLRVKNVKGDFEIDS